MMAATTRYITVSRRCPCAICHHTDWCRFIPNEVDICRRVGGSGSIQRTDKNGALYYIYTHSHADGRRAPQLPLVPQTERAGRDDLHRIYQALLYLLNLRDAHRKDLRLRGLSDAEINRRGYASLPREGRSKIASWLINQFGEHVCAGVPGIVRKQGDRRAYWSMPGAVGLLIPTRHTDGRITAITIRPDNPTTAKYIWLSSKSQRGPGPEVSCHVPLFDGNTRTLRISEGILKADVATVLSGILTIGSPSVTMWRLTLPVIEVLQPETILLAFDADWRSNSNVAKSLSDCAKHLHTMGLNTKVETWHPSKGKGVDDLLLSKNQPKIKPWQYSLIAKHRSTARKSKVTAHA